MSVYNVFKFFEFFKSNKKLNEKICSVLEKLDSSSFSNKDIINVANEIVLIGREYKFDFTRAELFEYLEQNFRNLTNKDLENVSGGFGRKAAGASLSAIAILSLGTGAIKFFNRDDKNKVYPERNAVSLKNGHDSEDEDFYNSVDENKKYKGGKNNWGDLLKNYTKDRKDTINEDFYKVPSFNRDFPNNKDKIIKRPQNLPNITLKNNNDSKPIGGSLKNSNQNSSESSVVNNKLGNQNSNRSSGVNNLDNQNLNRGSGINNNSGNQNSEFHGSFFVASNHIFHGKKDTVSESESYLYVVLNQIYYNNGLKSSIINSDSNNEMVMLLKNLFLKYDSNSDISEEINEFKELFKNKTDVYKFNLSEIYQDIMDELEEAGIQSKFKVDSVPVSENDESEQNENLDNESILGFDIEKVKNKKSLNKCFDKDGIFSDDLNNKYKLNEYPDNLTVYLNRFKYDDDVDNNLKKLNDSFEFSSKVSIDGHNYKLKTVIVNVGKADEGKYILYVNDNGSWKKLYESRIENVNFDDIKEDIEKNAVMATYEMVKKSL